MTSNFTLLCCCQGLIKPKGQQQLGWTSIELETNLMAPWWEIISVPPLSFYVAEATRLELESTPDCWINQALSNLPESVLSYMWNMHEMQSLRIQTAINVNQTSVDDKSVRAMSWQLASLFPMRMCMHISLPRTRAHISLPRMNVERLLDLSRFLYIIF